MTIQDWASLIVAILTIVSSIAFAIKWMVKHYLSELKPNSGSSMKDQISRLELALDDQRVDSERSRTSLVQRGRGSHGQQVVFDGAAPPPREQTQVVLWLPNGASLKRLQVLIVEV